MIEEAFEEAFTGLVCRRFEPTLLNASSPLYGHLPLYLFFKPPLWNIYIFDKMAPLKYKINIKINVVKNINEGKFFFMFRRLKNNLKYFYILQATNIFIYIKPEVWFQIITVSSIKMS